MKRTISSLGLPPTYGITTLVVDKGLLNLTVNASVSGFTVSFLEKDGGAVSWNVLTKAEAVALVAKLAEVTLMSDADIEAKLRKAGVKSPEPLRPLPDVEPL